MADWPMGLNGANVLSYNPAPSTYWTGVTGGAANTKGSWVEITSATTADIDMLIIGFNLTSGINDVLVDFAIGASGSEDVIIENLYHGAYTSVSRGSGLVHPLPIYIPAGERLSVRLQGNIAGSVVVVSVNCFSRGSYSSIVPVNSKITTYGADTTDSGGVGVDAGGTANTKGSWYEITSSCDYIRELFFAIGAQRFARNGNGGFHLDIGVGAAGSEVVVLPDYVLYANATSDVVTPIMSPILPIEIPSGTRISARAACESTSTGVRTFDIILYGVS